MKTAKQELRILKISIKTVKEELRILKIHSFLCACFISRKVSYVVDARHHCAQLQRPRPRVLGARRLRDDELARVHERELRRALQSRPQRVSAGGINALLTIRF